MPLTRPHVRASAASAQTSGQHPRSSLADRHMYPQDFSDRVAKHVLKRNDKVAAVALKYQMEVVESLEWVSDLRSSTQLKYFAIMVGDTSPTTEGFLQYHEPNSEFLGFQVVSHILIHTSHPDPRPRFVLLLAIFWRMAFQPGIPRRSHRTDHSRSNLRSPYRWRHHTRCVAGSLHCSRIHWPCSHHLRRRSGRPIGSIESELWPLCYSCDNRRPRSNWTYVSVAICWVWIWRNRNLHRGCRALGYFFGDDVCGAGEELKGDQLRGYPSGYCSG